MKRYFVLFAVLALLALPLVAGADNHGWSWDDTGWMPSWWTPTPPAGETVDAAQLLELLVQKGVITAQERAELARSQLALPAGQDRERARGSGLSYRTSP